MTLPRRPRVVIIGSGFGGLNAARSLARSQVEVLLIDRNNYHTFIPLLYQVAVAQLQPEQVAYPVRSILRRLPHANFLTAEVKRINFVNQVVETEKAAIPYDFLIVSTGSQTQFLGVPGAQKYALPMKTLAEAVYIRNHILSCFEQALLEPDATQQQLLLTFVIVGGGATGVELAGALIELIQGSLRKDYPTLDMRQVQVILLQGRDRLLADLPVKLCEYTHKQLRRRGVKVYLQAKVSEVTPNGVYLADGTNILAKTVIWTAGVAAAPLTPTAEMFPAAKNQVAVLPTLQLPEYPQVYVIGDSAYVEQDGNPLPLVAPVAMQQGTKAAQNILLQLQYRQPKPFCYVDKGRAAIIARNAGVAQTGKLKFTGFLAWLLWLAIHLYYLPGWHNRLIVLMNWIYDYCTRDRLFRVIFPSATLSHFALSTQLLVTDNIKNITNRHNQQH